MIAALCGLCLYIQANCESAKSRLWRDFYVETHAIARLVADYVREFDKSGSWPKPGSAYEDDSEIRYLRTQRERNRRVDVYGLPSRERNVEVNLYDDGTIRVSVEDRTDG